MKLCIWMQSVLKAENVWWKLVLLLYDDLMVAFIPNASHIKAMLSLIFFPFFFFSVEILSDMYIGWSILRSKWKYTSVKVLLHINGHAVLFYLLSRLYHSTFKSLLSVEKARILTITHIFPKPLHNHTK